MEGATNNAVTFQITSNLNKTGTLGNRQTVDPCSVTRWTDQIQVPSKEAYQQQTERQIPETAEQTSKRPLFGRHGKDCTYFVPHVK